MKKTRLYTILLLVLTLLCSIFILASCGGGCGNNNGDDPTPTPPTPTKLTAPTVVLTDDTATWSADVSADKFEISIDGNLSYIENSVMSKKLSDGQTFKVRAIGDGIYYTNSDWSNSVTYVKPISKYTITWKNGDTVLETDTEVSEGTVPAYDGAEPSKAADAQYSYVFAGWTPEIVTVNGDVTYTAVFTSVLNKYTVTWKNGDSALEIDENVPYGTVPVYNGAEPQKAADAQYVYVFSGWSPVLGEVVGNVTYVAQFTSEPNSYTIVWKNGDSVLETDENVTYGSTPSYDSATPTKDATAQYTYTFSGWTPQIGSVTGSATYQAQFTETLRTYTVTFYSEDGLTVLDAVTAEYGTNAVYSKSTPVKNTTAGNTYVFEKWVTTQGGSVEDDLTNVIGDRSVYASFKEFVRTVTVYIVPNNTNYGSVSVSVLNNVPYGETITVNENTITVNGQTVTANANTATAQYTYKFTNWTADATVGNDTVITANFSRSVNFYTITWKNGDSVLETDENVVYGTMPMYNGETPTKESDNEKIYTFSGWSPAISSVIGDITYYAEFTTAASKHIVIFYDDDGVTELGRVVVEHGATAIYPNVLPTKESTAEIAYTFEKWVTTKGGDIEASFTNITADKFVYAKYSFVAKKYKVQFVDWDGRVLEEQIVEYGNSATKPSDPEREGYRFDDWKGSFNNVCEDVVVEAKYIRQFTVEFLDYDDSIIDVQLVDINGNANAPEIPTRNNYKFTGWNTYFTNIASDLSVKAEYIRQYKVTFLDYDGTVIKLNYCEECNKYYKNSELNDGKCIYCNGLVIQVSEQKVDAGATAVSPDDPMLEGYTFDRWDKAFTCVSSDLTLTATYKSNTYKVTFKMPDGTIIDEKMVKHGEDAEAPMYTDDFMEGKVVNLSGLSKFPKLYFRNKKALYFSGWSDSLKDVKENREIFAEYEDAYDKPVLFVEQRENELKVYMYCPSNCYIYGLEFEFGWDGDGNISGCVEELGTNKDSEYNNDDKTFKYIMFDGVGYTSQSNYFDVATIAYSDLHGFVLDIGDINVLTNCSIIYALKEKADVSELVKITPIIVIK